MKTHQKPSSNRSLRLLVVSYSLHGGGAERFTSTLLNHLNLDCFDPSLCLVRGDMGYPLRPAIPVIILDKRNPWHLPRTILRLRKLISESEPDIILTTIAFTSQLVGAALFNLTKRPCWIARIGDDPSTSDRGFQRWLNSRIYLYADRIVTNSEGLHRSFSNCYPNTINKISTIYNPTDFSAIDRLAEEETDIQPRTNRAVIIYVGRLTPQKQPDLLIRAFHKVLSNKNSDAELWICGEGPLLGSMTQDINRFELVDRVKLLGFCSNPYALMKKASLFVMTSKHEGLPNALIEAQGLGLPAISTCCPHGPSEIIERGKTGYLTGVDDVNGLSEAISKLLDDHELRIKMGQAARIRSRSLFSQSILINEWERLLSQAYRCKTKPAANPDDNCVN